MAASTAKLQTRSLFYYFRTINDCVCVFPSGFWSYRLWKVYNLTQLHFFFYLNHDKCQLFSLFFMFVTAGICEDNKHSISNIFSKLIKVCKLNLITKYFWLWVI